jgi:hypothetical protein
VNSGYFNGASRGSPGQIHILRRSALGRSISRPLGSLPALAVIFSLIWGSFRPGFEATASFQGGALSACSSRLLWT